MKKMLHKIFSILLAACFILSAVPAPAAAAENPANEVTNGSYVDGVWKEGGNGSVTYTVDKHPMTLSKTAEVVGENTFKITLTVETESKTITHTVDGAVVLVIDLSNSMARCAECGADPNGFWWGESHERDCTYRSEGASVKSNQSRLAAAKVAARNFLAAYAGDDASANRQLAIVTFSNDGATVMGWKNVAGGSNDYETALATINRLGANGGTNMEGGLLNAYNLLDDVTCDSKSVVMLSDGAPTYGVTVQGSGSEGSSRLNAAVANQASAIKNAGAMLYTVCYGAANEATYNNGPTVGNFLRDSVASSGCAYNANNTAALNSAFAAIVEEINEGLVGQGLEVTDPMADMIDMKTVITDGANFTNTDGSNTYTWTLDEHEDKTVGDTVHHVYTCSYTVELDVLDENFVEGDFFPTNERTYLTVNDKEYDFPVPGVKGVLPRTDISVTKKWEDNDNQDGMRTESVTVQLVEIMADETMRDIGAPVVLDADNSWTHTWDGETYNLLVKSKGVVHEYQVVETEVPTGYTSTPGTADNGFTVTNTHVPEKISISGTKTWEDANNQDNIRPKSITINLYANETFKESQTVTADNDWAWSFTNLDKFAEGKEIKYTITEEAVDGYTTDVQGYNVTNTHVLDKTSVTVTKNWDDAENQDKKRPDSVTIHLFADGVDTGKALTLSEDNKWTGTFSDLIKNREGKVGEPVEYTVTEDAVPNYEKPDIIPVDGGFKITNTHVLDKTSVTVTKDWDDAKNQDGKRPGSITIHLFADNKDTGKTLTLSEDNEWTGTFSDLIKNREGKVGEPVVYTVTEDAVPNYENPDITPVDGGFKITNTHAPEKTAVTVTKKWDDAENQDGKRPQSITVKLLAGGEETGKELTLTATENWTGTFSNLDKYADAKEIAYTVEEDAVANYELIGITGSAKDGYTITNSYTPETTIVSGSKTWDDDDNRDNIRPESITINLSRNGKIIDTMVVTEKDGWAWTFEGLDKYENGGKLVTYVITEEIKDAYTPEVNGYDVTNTYAPEQTAVTVTKAWDDDNNRDGIRANEVTVKLLANGKDTEMTLVLNQGNNWSDTFTNLPKKDKGVAIIYTVEEVSEIKDYTASITGDAKEGFTITNTHEPETVTISGTKTWDDGNNQDRTRPEAITVKLMDNGTEVQSTEVKPDANGKWTWTFTAPKYNKGVEIPYTVEEVVPEGYNATYPEGTYDIENFYSPETINIKVTKAWIDGDNQDGLRPEEIVVKLTADLTDFEATLKLNEDNKWTASFEELDKNFDGKEITYTLEEVTKVEGYDEPVIEGDHKTGFTVKNIHEPEVTEVIGKKTWNDANNQDGKRPESITVKLLANGQVVDTQVVSEKESWIYSFENLPKFEAGEEIIYTVVENEVPGYSATYSKDNYNITNSYTPETINIKVSKSWVDSNDADGIRPTKVTIYLYANGEKTGDKLVLTKDEKWTGSFTDLPKYEDGKEIKYTIAEKDVKGYNAVIKGSAGNGFTVTNSHNSIPKTGDERTPILWIAMMLLAIIVVFFASRPFFYKKGKYSR